MTVDDPILWKAALVAGGVSEGDADFVVRVGIPEGQVGHLIVQPEVDDAVVLAVDGSVPLVVEAGRVVARDGTNRLVNTSVPRFVSMVARYKQYVDEVLRIDTNDEGERVAREATEDMRDIDPTAFENSTSYWPIICAQMVEGNL